MPYTHRRCELAHVEKDHDWTYKMSIKITGSKNNTKFMAISHEEFKGICDVLYGLNYDFAGMTDDLIDELEEYRRKENE